MNFFRKLVFFGIGFLGIGFFSYGLYNFIRKLKYLGEDIPSWIRNWIEELKEELKKNNYIVNINIASHFYNLEKSLASYLKNYEDDEVDIRCKILFSLGDINYFLDHFSDVQNHLSDEDKKAKLILNEALDCEIEEESLKLLGNSPEEEAIKLLINNVRIDPNVPILNQHMVKKYTILQGEIYDEIFESINDSNLMFKNIQNAYILKENIKQSFAEAGFEICENRMIMNLYLNSKNKKQEKLINIPEIYEARASYYKVKLLACKNKEKENSTS